MSNTLTVFAPEMIIAGGDPRGEMCRYYDLATGQKLFLSEAEALHDKSWHIAFKRSIIKVNGGVAGPGGIIGGCVSAPFDVSREKFLALSPADLQTKFDAVKEIPSNAVFEPEGVEPAIAGWWKDEGGALKPNEAKCWKLRLANGTSFAKLRIKEVGAGLQYAVVEYGLQETKGEEVRELRTGCLVEGQGFRFALGSSVVPEGDAWDVKLSGGKICLNSSASGPGMAGAIGSNIWMLRWEYLNPSDSVAYFMDEVGSLFRTPKWYRYNINGTHDIHPNGAVYGLRTAQGDFKIQVYDYFTHKGSDIGNFKIRYAKL